MSTINFVKEEGRIPRLNSGRLSVRLEIPLDEKVRIVTNSLQQGTSVSKTEWKTVKLSERDKGLTWYDFSIDSLTVSGLISQMKYSQLEDSRLANADVLDNVNVPVPEAETPVQNETTTTE